MSAFALADIGYCTAHVRFMTQSETRECFICEFAPVHTAFSYVGPDCDCAKQVEAK
jgi:hypothetical protein